MNKTHIFELRDEPDKYPGFLQVFTKDPPDAETWREDVATRAIEFGAKPFSVDYVPVPLEFNNEGKRKKNVAGDICLSTNPFIILSDKARQALDVFLSPVGEFLDVGAPVPGFIGYRVLKHLDHCVDLERSTYSRADNGNVLVRKPAMYEATVRDHDIFAISNAGGVFVSGVFVSQAFKAAVEAAKLKAFNFSREVPLV